MSIIIKNFTVSDTTTGKMAQTGRYTNAQVDNILSHITYLNGVRNKRVVQGTPSTISSGDLYGNAHMSTSFIKIIHDFRRNTQNDCIYVPDGMIRLVYLGGSCAATNSLLYGFAPKLTTNISTITFNVVIAKNTSQTKGDYFDIALPDRMSYPNLHIVFILLCSAWTHRTIVSGNICSISASLMDNTNLNFCIDPSKSIGDINQSHFIISQGLSTTFGIYTRIIIGIEDLPMSGTDRDYNDCMIAISSKTISESQLNDTTIS